MKEREGNETEELKFRREDQRLVPSKFLQRGTESFVPRTIARCMWGSRIGVYRNPRDFRSNPPLNFRVHDMSFSAQERTLRERGNLA